MIQFFKKNIESNKKLRTFEIIVLCLLGFYFNWFGFLWFDANS